MYKQNKKMQAGTYLFDHDSSMPFGPFTFKRMDVIADANAYGGFTALYYADHAGLDNQLHTNTNTPNGGTLVEPPFENVTSNPGTLNGNFISGGAGDLWVFNFWTTMVFVVDVANQTIKLWNCNVDWGEQDDVYMASSYTIGSGGGGSASGDPFITPMIC